MHAVQASDIYMQVMQGTVTKNIDDRIIDFQNQLVNDYADTPYAALSALALAKVEYEKGNAESAVAQLELAIKHANDDVIKQIASLRLASVYLEQKKYDEALTLLNTKHDSAYDARYEELKGDLFSARGDVAEARAAYDKAIKLQGFAASKWLRLKRQNLGEAAAEKTGAVQSRVNSVHLPA